jgi:two-component system CheB/CheR fusion protein
VVAAKKRKDERAKSSEEPKPDQPPSKAGDTPEEPAPAPAAAVPEESQPGPSGPPITGIGASAGGLDAFKKLFAAMPADSGVAFVLVPHLDPAHESLMVELVARHTTMPVVEAENGLRVEANRVYIIPPNKYMTIHGGVLRLTGPVERRTSQTSIDLFLRSLADDQQERSICIILSGTGSHGSLGLKAIKAAGGMAMVQDPTTAEYDRMPQSAVATGLADYVLPVEQMPEALVSFVKHAYVNGGIHVEVAPEAADHLTKLLALLRTRIKFDFRCYRKKMLTRRVERRMGLNHIDSIPEYLTYLREHPEELKHLVKDLFISVTSFFRDPEAFQQLASQVIVPLVQGKESDATIRIWVPGCATGEEPYSIAMLVQEQLAVEHKSCKVQIFATDVDEEALEMARQGLYPDSIAADVTPERLARFFTHVDEHNYRISKELRETMIFAPQNLISDAPFTKLDLISCRNLLIYLEPEVQKKVITLFNFALSEGGFLFLGSSETVGRQIDLFESMSKKWRIYRRIGPNRMERVDFPLVPTVEGRAMVRRPAQVAEAKPTNFAEVAQRLLMDRFAPASVLINRKYEICYYFGPCEDYLKPPTGTPTHDLTLMAREGLDTKLRGAVHRAVRDSQTAVVNDVRVKRKDGYHPVRVTVQPVQAPRAPDGLLLITFEDEAASQRPTPAPTPQVSAEGGDDASIRQLESELRATREDLQTTIEELESSNEELKSSNEEVMSMNEELQSANEELETSKEELQSLNEEMSTVNSQLRDKVEELETASNDITNLLDCTDIATLFLDTDFRIKRFTPVATKLFRLINSDIGRPIADITFRFTEPDLLEDTRQVLKKLLPSEKEVTTPDGSWLRRIMPYRTHDNRIEGVVLTFSEVTALRQSDAALHAQSASEATALRRLHQASTRLWRTTGLHEGLDEMLAATIEMLQADKGNVQLLDVARGVLLIATHRGFEQPFLDFFREVSAHTDSACGRALRHGTQIVIEDVETDESFAPLQAIASAAGFRAVVSTPMLGRDGRPLGIISVHFHSPHRPSEQELRRLDLYARRAADFVERCRTEETLRARDEQLRKLNESLEHQVAERTQTLQEREARMRAILDSTIDAIITIDYRGIIQSVNPGAEKMFGYTAAEMVGQSVNMLMPSPYRETHDGYVERYLQTGVKHIIGTNRETVARRKDGSVFPTDLAVSQIPHLKLFSGIHRDLTERKKLERDLVEIASQTQQQIGQDLHDTVSQELTALNIQATDLSEMLRTDPASAAKLIEQITKGLRSSQQKLRVLMRGLLPVSVDAEGLMAALSDLADRTHEENQVTCTFNCPKPVSVSDNLTAMHLYFIAQEAVHNALKHARARNIRISLESNDLLTLCVQDDGAGIDEVNRASATNGLGLRIMRNRAAIIGATLTIEQVQPTGTRVLCTLPRPSDAQKENDQASPDPDRG